MAGRPLAERPCPAHPASRTRSLVVLLWEAAARLRSGRGASRGPPAVFKSRGRPPFRSLKPAISSLTLTHILGGPSQLSPPPTCPTTTMRAAALCLLLLALCGASSARVLLDTQALPELPASITCNTSLLLSAGVVDPAYACSPGFYNCLGVEAGQPGPLQYCQDGLVFDKVGAAVAAAAAADPPLTPRGPAHRLWRPWRPSPVACPFCFSLPPHVWACTHQLNPHPHPTPLSPPQTFPWSAESPVPSTQGGACNYWTPACGAQSPGAQPSSPTPAGRSPSPVTPSSPSPVTPAPSPAPVPVPGGCAIANYACVDSTHFCLAGYSMLCAPGPPLLVWFCHCLPCWFAMAPMLLLLACIRTLPTNGMPTHC